MNNQEALTPAIMMLIVARLPAAVLHYATHVRAPEIALTGLAIGIVVAITAGMLATR